MAAKIINHLPFLSFYCLFLSFKPARFINIDDDLIMRCKTTQLNGLSIMHEGFSTLRFYNSLILDIFSLSSTEKKGKNAMTFNGSQWTYSHVSNDKMTHEIIFTYL